MDFHIAGETRGGVLCCAAMVASAFRRVDWQKRIVEHCLPTGAGVRHQGSSGQEKFEEAAG
jgi:hypothetical protein